MKYHIIITICFLFVANHILAQYEMDFINLNYRQNLNAAYKDADEFRFKQKSFGLVLKKPFSIKETKNYLIPQLSYNFLQINNNVYQNDHLNAHNTNVGLAWYREWKNPNWASYLEMGGGIYSDLKSWDKSHMNANATLLFHYGKSESLVWNFGVDYVGGAFGHWVVPLLGVDWSINDRTHLSFQTFSHLSLDYFVSERFSLGIYASSNPFSMNISDYYGYPNSFVYSYSNTFPFAPQEAGLGFDAYVTKDIALFGNIGYEFAKELSHQDSEGNYIEDSAYNGKIKPNLLFQIGIAFRTNDFRKKRK